MIQQLPVLFSLKWLLTAFAAVILSVGCSSQPRSYGKIPGLQQDSDCSLLLSQMETRIRQQGAEQGWGHPLYGYPYLRSNRLLASFRTELESIEQQQQWWQSLWDLGYIARQLQLENLEPGFNNSQRQTIETCLQDLAAEDRQHPQRWQEIKRQSRVPDSYNDGLRVLGLFPLTRLPVLKVISAELATWERAFNNPQFIQGANTTYGPPQASILDANLVAGWLKQARGANSLGIPNLSESQLQQLFLHHSPAWRLYYHSDADKIGTMAWRSGAPYVDIRQPSTYLLPSFTRFHGQVLLQLNYLVWFPERAAEQGDSDLYSGLLDGLIWRVTLGQDGQVLAYDSIHPCGCYHKIYPVSEQLEISDRVEIMEVYEEIPLILDENIPNSGDGRVLIHLYPDSHYVVGLSPYQPESNDSLLQLQPYQALMNLPTPEGNRSLFASDGLVPASKRGERYFLWPMGVKSAGAMRQWGHHAISFTGNRHFDDPFLLQQFLVFRSETTLSRGN
ncbi:MAG: hypothetical protein OQK12_15710 [Motiliproteus sp.]|nr:hypothetical protein [Motiliproteus sp.]MCW9051324.1 hypothetical protein [Motiliproteus sp.]